MTRSALVMQRARSPRDKDARRSALVDAARSEFEAAGYDAVTIERVAAGAGVAKGTAYLYFATKEALFLALLVRELDEWFDVLELDVARGSGDMVGHVARTFARTLGRRPVLVQLLSLLHGRLEPNTPAEPLRRFKYFLADRVGRAAAAIEQVAGLAPGHGVTLLLRAHALTIGLGPMADPPVVVREIVAADPALAAFATDFERELASCLEDMLHGWLR
jgi:AcrR family transcriptional regulator